MGILSNKSIGGFIMFQEKRILAVLLSALLILPCVACTNGNDPSRETNGIFTTAKRRADER